MADHAPPQKTMARDASGDITSQLAPGTPYLICTLPRSGSTLLASGLSRTGVAGCPEEFFWAAQRESYLKRWSMPTDATDRQLLDRIRLEGTYDRVFGAKLHWAQFATLERMLRNAGDDRGQDQTNGAAEAQWTPSHDLVDSYLPGVRYIHLTRRDKTAQAISLYRASASDVWFRRPDAGPPRGSSELPYDAGAIERLERQLRANDWRWVSYLEFAGAKPLSIAYEELEADYRGTVERVLDFLDLPRANRASPCPPPLRKQRDGMSREWGERVVRERAARVAARHRSIPSVSVVVVTHNEGENLRRTVDAFAATVPDSTEILVVDDWSTDRSLETVAAYDRVRVVRPPEPAGVAGARNFGAARANGDVLVFSDAHVDPNPGWLGALCATLADPSVAAVAPAVSHVDRRSEKGYGFTWRDPSLAVRWIGRRPSAPAPVPFLCGCFMSIRRTDFETVGGFDGGLARWGYEDAEISLNLWRLGRQCMVVPGAEVAHLFRPQFPYRVDAAETLHNRLRLATVHFSRRALAAVLADAGRSPAFAEAYASLLGTDAWERRSRIEAAARHDTDWFMDRFRMGAFS